MITNSDGSFVMSPENDFFYFDKLPKRLREYVANYPRKIASYPIARHYANLQLYSSLTEDEMIDYIISNLEKSK